MNSRNVAVSNDNMVLLREMLIAQNAYIVTKMKDKAFKKAYLENIAPLMVEAHTCSDFTDFTMYFDVLSRDILNRKKPFYKKFFTSSEKEGTEMAFSVVQEVIESINVRFVTGGHKLYENLLKVSNVKKR